MLEHIGWPNVLSDRCEWCERHRGHPMRWCMHAAAPLCSPSEPQGGKTVILRPAGLRPGHKMCYLGPHSWLWGDECSLNVVVEQVACVQSWRTCSFSCVIPYGPYACHETVRCILVCTHNTCVRYLVPYRAHARHKRRTGADSW